MFLFPLNQIPAYVPAVRGLTIAWSLVLNETHSNPWVSACFTTAKFCGTTKRWPSRTSLKGWSSVGVSNYLKTSVAPHHVDAVCIYVPMWCYHRILHKGIFFLFKYIYIYIFIQISYKMNEVTIKFQSSYPETWEIVVVDWAVYTSVRSGLSIFSLSLMVLRVSSNPVLYIFTSFF